jgi:hypothetical protein
MLEYSEDNSAMTWSQIFVRYLYWYELRKRNKADYYEVAHRMNVTLFRRTEEAAESFQVVSSGQYMT